MSEQLTQHRPTVERDGEAARAIFDRQCEEVRRRSEAAAARLLTDMTPIRFTLSDEDRPARKVEPPKLERHLTQFEIDSRPERGLKWLRKRIHRRLVSKSLLRVDSY